MTKEIINHAEDSTSFLKGSINSEATHRFLNFQTHINNINLLNSKNFMNTNSDLLESSIDKNTHPLLIKLNNKLHNNFSSFSIYNTKGIKISSYNNSKNWFDLGFDISNLRIYKSSILGNPTQDKNLWYSTSLKNYFVIISAPIYGSKTSNLSNFQSTIISGVVVATYSVSLLLNDITSRHADKDNIVYMLSNDGTIVYSNLINRSKNFPSISNFTNYTIGSKFNDHPIYKKITNSSNSIESGIYPYTSNSITKNSLFVAAKGDPGK